MNRMMLYKLLFPYTVKRLLFLFIVFLLGCLQAQTNDFDRWFDGRTLRLDCLREGSSEHDTVWVERWCDRQSDWYGSYTHLIDSFNNGDYCIAIRDMKTGKLLYSRGYNTLFGEYKNTPKGLHTLCRFEETLLVPMPRSSVEIVLQKRDSLLRLTDATVVYFDPTTQILSTVSNQHVKTIQPSISAGGTSDTAFVLERHGSSSTKVDVVLVMQGYEHGADSQCRADMDRMREMLFENEPFTSHRNDFNVYAVVADVGASYGTFEAERYLMTFNLWRLHDAIGVTPCDFIIIAVNDTRYGGGAIYNFYAVTSLHRNAHLVLPHELGHAMGGLADEYVDENLSYGGIHRRQYEPLEPNITNLKNFASKWQSLLPKDTSIPTPFDATIPRSQCGPLGVYEGAGYAQKGVFRPTPHCMMRDYAPFCPVCRHRIETVFSLYTQ